MIILQRLSGEVKKFDPTTGVKIPQMGWNRVSVSGKGKECPLLKGIDDGAYFYFDHSYYVAPGDKAIVAGTTDYGIDFASMIWRDNIFCVQFHPEKSGPAGLRVLANFCQFGGAL